MSMYPIASTTVNATTTISFTSIPQTFTHLQLRISGGHSGGQAYSAMKFNNDTTYSNYYAHELNANGSTATSVSWAGSSYNGIMVASNGMGTNVYPGTTIWDILDYTNTNKNKTTRALIGYDANGSGMLYLSSGLWLSTSAINRIDITSSGLNFSNTRADLYGISTSNATGA